MMATAQATHSVKLRRNPLCSATTESTIGMHAKKALRISDFVLGMTVWALAISSTERAPNELVNWRRSPAGAQGTNSGQ